ncbi:hypothetical protein HY408_00280 [Candidatus Gottesmanbacteria bacterium]|nr:hypothetical protein [Candidatus Gottesmanbacteria bacterium]
MVIAPYNARDLIPGDAITEWIVSLFSGRNEAGRPDASGFIDECILNGTTDDFPEIIDTFGGSFSRGIPPEEMFRDIDEATVEGMRRIYEGYRSNK